MTTCYKIALLIAVTALTSKPLYANTMEEIVVTADFYQTSAMDIASSVTIMDDQIIEQRHAEHLEQLFGLAPNVNYATGASRGRFIQIRGIGERSEYTDPVNYSVGVLLDGIDFTGISTAASTLDIQQVEILRGPQGTLYGANALAGLINLVSANPTETTQGKVEASLGNYGSHTLKGAVGGPLSEQIGYRIAAQTTQSDGFYENSYLGRNDTNNIDETTLRGKLKYSANADLDLGLTLFYADVDNGYDVFNYESNRQTRSNEPGHDRQETLAAAVNANWRLNDQLSLSAVFSAADSDIEYGYDEDWRNPDLCIEETCTFGPDGYHTAFDNLQRDNANQSLDVRLRSQAADGRSQWVLGGYYRDQQVDLTRTYSYSGFDTIFGSDYNTKNAAIYGDWTQALGDKLAISVGARLEDRQSDYLDSDTFGFDTDESLWGSKLSLTYTIDEQKMAYATVSRGYKPGGANANSSVPQTLRKYDTETMLNYELGFRGLLLDNTLETQIAVFYQDRSDIQADSSIVTCPGAGQPCSFDDYLTNAATGDNLGLEAQLRYFLTQGTSLYGSLGILDATYGHYINYNHVDANESSGIGVNMNDRKQPHAPSYQFMLGLNKQLSDQLSASLNLEGKDNFLFSNDHDFWADAYVLVNADLTYAIDNWRVSVWGKNLTDEDYQNRAFGTFGNDPRNGYTTELYSQPGEPRTFGVTGRYQF